MFPFYQLAFRNMHTRLVRTTLTTAGIVLGVAVILAIAVTNESTLASIRNLFDEVSGKAQLIVQSANETGAGFDQSIRARIQSTEGVQVVAPSATARSVLASEMKDWQLNISIAAVGGSNEFLLFGIDPSVDEKARVYTLIEGRFLRDADEQALVIVKDYADEHQIKLNKDLQLITPNGLEAFRVVGIMTKEGPGRLNNGAMGVTGLRVLQDKLGRGRNVDAIDVVVTPSLTNSPDMLAEVKRRIEERIGPKYSVVYPASRGQLISQLLATYQQGLGFFSAIALFVGAFLIYNVFSMTVVERTREIGLLRSLGATRGQVLMLVLSEALLLGIVGSLLGVLAGLGLARGLNQFMAVLVHIDIPRASIPQTGLVSALGTGLIVTLVAAWLPARRASQITPIEALAPNRSRRASFIARWVWLVGLELVVVAMLAIFIPVRREVLFAVGSYSMFSLLFGAALLIPGTVALLERFLRPVLQLIYGGEGLIGSGNIQRARGRTALTIAALMVGVCLVISINAMTISFRSDINQWLENAIGGDLYVRSPLPMRFELGARLNAVEGVRAVTPTRYFNVKRIHPLTNQPDTDTSIVFVAIEPVSYQQTAHFKFATGTRGTEEELLAQLAAGNAVFIGATLADKFQLKQGDQIRLNSQRGDVEFTVAAVIVDFTAQGNTITGSWGDMRRYWGVDNVSHFTLKLAPGYAGEAVRQQIKDRYGEAFHLQLETSHDYRERITKVSDQSFALFDVLNLIGIIIAALGVVNTLMMNVLERLREIGMLRGLGMTRAQVGKMILAESAAIGLIGALFGLAFGLLLSQIFLHGINSLNGYELKFIWPVAAVLEGIVLAVLISQVAAAYPAWRASRTNIVSAIQHE